MILHIDNKADELQWPNHTVKVSPDMRSMSDSSALSSEIKKSCENVKYITVDHQQDFLIKDMRSTNVDSFSCLPNQLDVNNINEKLNVDNINKITQLGLLRNSSRVHYLWRNFYD
jgi:hypothetical protein